MLLTVTALAVAAHAVPAAAQPIAPLGRALGVATTSAGPGVRLTFDDGPHPEGTPAVLDVLARAHATATFFLVGEQVARGPALVGEIVAAGHRVGLHGDRHRNLLRLGPHAPAEDLRLGWERIAATAGVAPDEYRPPYAMFNGTALAVARRGRWQPLLWTHWGRDWDASATATSIPRRLTEGLQPGAVLLLHDADHYAPLGTWREMVRALPRGLEALDERGLTIS